MVFSAPKNVVQTKSDAKYLPFALAFICLLAVAFIGIPAHVFFDRIFHARFHLPATVEGDIELLVVFALFALASTLIRRPPLYTIIILLIATLYLQSHSVLLPALLGIIFLESILQVGAAVQRLIGMVSARSSNPFSYLEKFIIGAASWLLGALMISISGFGTLPLLRFYSIVVALISFAFVQAMPLSLTLLRRFE